jgi:hypothetical protein
MDAETRRKLVLEYVRIHPGCMKEDITEGLKNSISRVPVFNTLRDLLEDNALRDESNNRRDHKLYVNSDNLLVSVPRELEDFEKAYINLLQNSAKRINEKDFSTVSKMLGIKESNPTKWNESEMVKYSNFEFERLEKSLETKWKNVDLLNRESSRLEHVSDRYGQFLDKNDALLDKLYEKEISSLLTELDELDTEIEHSYDIREFEISLLTHGAVALFYLLRDTLFYRSILIWSNTVHDKEALKKLYTIVYTGIANLQLELVKFLSLPKVRLIANPVEYKNPVGFIIQFTRTMSNNTLSSLILWYYEMGMLQFIEPIATSISDINKEIKDSGYPNPIFHQLEYAFDQIKLSEECIVRKQEARIRLQKSKGKLQQMMGRLDLKRQTQQLRRKNDTLTSKHN